MKLADVRLSENQKKLNRREAIKRYADKNQVKIKAKNTVYEAIKYGRLKREPCELCNYPAFYSEAHHHDYSKPLDVIWLCPDCHRLVHTINRTI